MNDQLTVLSHPLVGHIMTELRDQNTSPHQFRALVRKLSMLLCYEATRDLPTVEKQVITPVAPAQGVMVDQSKLVFLPILRAGLGMLDGALELVPDASVGHLGMYRDEETLTPVHYYTKLPPQFEGRGAVILDPMLATGGSAVDAVEKAASYGPAWIKFLCILSAPQGIEKLSKAYPDVKIYTAAVDQCLNDHGYIVPGLGDAGDRIFGTVG
ncbi:uracil phosphoribosyltransferase [Solibaculum mannosilyticum]|uniref:Uracil phosphoribosyltransferase n=1 Tax=Solibaculum mannosilyticum TaxID=2780922 RepID=A0A7I8D0H6_9FIRM|nr:uracil phosphoribosyltransferase [Solibaculum mannosilyticum]BCI60236.1 uracil phosphoribosyltransferase [Solibaculum mannosilyticum]